MYKESLFYNNSNWFCLLIRIIVLKIYDIYIYCGAITSFYKATPVTKHI